MGDITIDGARVRQLRQAAGLSLTELAVASRVGRNTVIGVEAGSGGSTLRTLGRLAAALGVEPASLLQPTCNLGSDDAQAPLSGEAV